MDGDPASQRVPLLRERYGTAHTSVWQGGLKKDRLFAFAFTSTSDGSEQREAPSLMEAGLFMLY